MPASPIPGWSAEQLEAHACAIIDRQGQLLFRSEALGRLVDSSGIPLGSDPRSIHGHPDPEVRPAAEKWLAFILSGVPARLGISSGRIDLPRRLGGTVRCRWEYFGAPPSDPDYHLLIYEPIDEAVSRARQALRMEGALFEIQAIVDGVGLTEPHQEMSDPVDLAALTERELDVMKQILGGNSNHQIARSLHVSLETVKSHTKSIFRKLGLHSRTELMARFVTSVGIVGSVILELPSVS